MCGVLPVIMNQSFSMVLVDDRMISTKSAFGVMHLMADELQDFVISLCKESLHESFLLPLIHSHINL